MRPVMALDFESNGLDVRCSPEFQTLGYAYYISESDNGYISYGHIEDNKYTKLGAINLLQDLVEEYTVVMHNAQFDVLCAKRLGVEITDYYCTMIGYHMCWENQQDKSLNTLAKKHFNETKVQDPTQDAIVKSLGWAWIPVYLHESYAVQDARLCYRLFKEIVYPQMRKEGFCE